MPTPAPESASAGIDLAALDEITDAVARGAGLPEVVRAAARALDASLALRDSTREVLAVAARSSADERALLADAKGVETLELRVADAVVGTLCVRYRAAATPASDALLRIVSTLVGSEVERVRAPDRASAEAITTFLRQLLSREPGERADVLARAGDLGLRLEGGASVLVARAYALVPEEDGWRQRALAIAERGGRAVNGAIQAMLAERPDQPGLEIVIVVPGTDVDEVQRCAEGVLRELRAGLGAGHSFALGRSRVASDVLDLGRAANEALLAANVAESAEDATLLAFDQTGAYRLLLSAMAEDPGELQRFYAETIEPLVAYDEQYETDLVRTVEAFLEADGNVAGTAQRLFTHRHTIRYRLERVRELSELDVGSTDGREKLSLGLKAMRVLGIAARSGPASESGARGGRVPRRRGAAS